MSRDYLSALAAGYLSTAPAIVPRLPARFEAGASASVDAAASGGPADGGERVPLAEQVGDATAEGAPVPRRFRDAVTESPARDEPARRIRPELRRAPADGDGHRADGAGIVASKPMRSVETLPHAALVDDGVPVRASRRLEADPVQSSSSPRAVAVSPERIRHAEDEAAAGPVAPRVVGRVAAPATSAPIEVTIGRIVVRAVHPVTPTPPAARRVPGPPAMTLEQYLRERREHRR